MKEAKRSNKGVWIGGGICAGICLFLILALVLTSPILAWKRRGDAADVLEQTGEVKAILTDPKQSGADLFSTAEVILDGEEAKAVKEKLYTVLKNSRFQATKESDAGVWLISVTISVNGGEQEVRVYLEEGGISLAHSGKLTTYQIKDSASDLYQELYEDVRQRLWNVA